ncbi:MAG: hypothetical protein NWE92_13920 [Candidatus Bathyarchaeota archaeon]|nr:hypothetical protein [Candidatus Bathyarchaeota archaeon]
MNTLASRLGFWSALILAVLVFLIDAGMILSTILFPLTSITDIETYASTFSSSQMLPMVPSLALGTVFVVLMSCIHFFAPKDKKFFSQLGVYFSLICATVLSIHYYIQLSFVQQSLLNHELLGLWLFVAPNPHSLFWTLAALGYAFMGISLLCVVPLFLEKPDRKIKWLLIANGILGLIFLVGNALGIFIVNILVSFAWGILFPLANILIARRFPAKTQPET